MARLAKEWAESTFALPREVEIMERDMSNGYVLAHMVRQAGLVNEDDYEFINDSPNPEEMLKNFSVLNRACKQIGITVTKRMVAEILSEQPGSAAALVMEIKKGIAKKGKPVSHTPAYKESLKSTRPNPKFVRQSDKYKSLSVDDKFIADAFNSLDITNFTAIDQRCQQKHYEAYKHEVDVLAANADDADEQIRRQVVQVRKERDIEALRAVKAAREAREAQLKENWKVTQRHKKERQIRDLHFENAVYAVRELKAIRVNQVHDQEQAQGIDQFEQIMRRAGISQGDDDSTQLQSTYEEGEAFIRRLEATAQKKWPTNESVNDFMVHLKETTRANRQARHEKAVRKRRMLVEQQAAAAASATKAQEALEYETLAATQRVAAEEAAAAEEKARVKRERAQEVQEKSLATTQRIDQDAELFLQIFSEQQRMMAAENDRDEEVQRVLLEQEKRRAEKHASAIVMCRSIVLDFIAMNSTFGFAELAEGASRMKRQFCGVDVDADLMFSDVLLESCQESLNSYSEGHDRVNSALPMLGRRSPPSTAGTGSLRPPLPSTAFDCIEPDQWAVAAATVKNMGRWARVPGSAEVDAENPNPIPETYVRAESFSENCQATLSTLLRKLIAEREEEEARRPPVPMVSAEEGQGGDSVPVPDPGAPAPPKVDNGVDLIPLLHCSPAELQRLRTPTGGDSSRRVVLVCGSTDSGKYGAPCAAPSEAQWGRALQALGGEDVVSAWDIAAALEAGKKLQARVVEGKQPLSFASLVELASKGGLACPPELAEAKLSAQATRAATDLMDYCGKMFGLTQVVLAAGANDIPLASLPFSDVSLCAVLGLVLWLRAYVQDVWAATLGADKPCPLANTVVAGKLHSRVAALSKPVHVKVVQWLLQGGTKDTVENDPELDVALQAEGAPKKPPAAAAGEKGAPSKQASTMGAALAPTSPSEDVTTRLELSCIFWLRMAATTDVAEPPRAITPVAAPGESKAPPYAPTPREFAALLLEKFARAVDNKAPCEPTTAEFPLCFSNYWKHPTPVCCLNTTCASAVVPVSAAPEAELPVAEATAAPEAAAAPAAEDEGDEASAAALVSPEAAGVGAPPVGNRWLTLDTDSSLSVAHSLVAAVLGVLDGENAEAVAAIISQSSAAALAAATPVDPPELEEGQSPPPVVVTEAPAVMRAVLEDLWNGRLATHIDEVSRARLLALETADKMWVMHKLGAKVLNAASVLACLEALQSSDALPLEWYTLLWSVLCNQVGFVNHNMQRLVCMFVNEVKRPDERLRTVCLEFLDKVQQKLPPPGGAASPTKGFVAGGAPSGWGEGSGALAASGAATLPAMHGGRKGASVPAPKPPGAGSLALSMTHRGKITADSTMLTALPDQQKFLETGVAELLCTIGNMVDNKHKDCLTLSMHLQEELRACLNTVCSNLQADVTPLLVQACVCILNERQGVAATLVRRLSECGYALSDAEQAEDAPEEFPVGLVLLPTSRYTSASAAKFAIEKRRGELRGTIATMHSVFNAVARSVEGEEDNVHHKTQEYEWSCWQRVLTSSFAGAEGEAEASAVAAAEAGTDVSVGGASETGAEGDGASTGGDAASGVASNGARSKSNGAGYETAARVYQELYLEALDTVDGFLRGVVAQVRRVDALSLEVPRRVMGAAVHNCIRYQHAMLRRWSGELREAFEMDPRTGRVLPAPAEGGGGVNAGLSLASGNSASMSLKSVGGSVKSFDTLPQSRRGSAAVVAPAWYAAGVRFLGRYYFGVSDSVLDDEVPWVSGQGLVDAQDFALPPAQMLNLATEMNVIVGQMLRGRSDEPGQGPSAGALASPEALVHDSLVRCVQGMVNKGMALTQAWTDSRRVRQLAECFPQQPFPAPRPSSAPAAAAGDDASVGSGADASSRPLSQAHSEAASRRNSEVPAVPQTGTDDEAPGTRVEGATAAVSRPESAAAATDNSRVHVQVVRRFFQKLLMTLVLGITPVGPSVDYTFAVCRAAISTPSGNSPGSFLPFTPLPADEAELEDSVGALSVENFVAAMRKNDKVLKGWWRDPAKVKRAAEEAAQGFGRGRGQGKTSASVTSQAMRLSTSTPSGTGSLRGGKVSTGRVTLMRSSNCQVDNIHTVPLSPSTDAVTLLHALALVCTDVRQQVLVDELLAVLCMCPVSFVAGPGSGMDNMVLSSGIGAESDAASTVTGGEFYAAITNRSLFKLAALAQRLVAPTPDAAVPCADGDNMTAFATSSGALLPPARLVKYSGAPLTLHQWQWVAATLRRQGGARVDAERLFRGRAPGDLQVKSAPGGNSASVGGMRIALDEAAVSAVNITDCAQVCGANERCTTSAELGALFSCEQLCLRRAL